MRPLNVIKHYHPDVTRIRDALRDVTITVSAEDCKTGISRSLDGCALAQAAKHKYDGAIVAVKVAYLIKGKTATRYKVPEYISREIVAFDRVKKFEPGKYELYAPTSSMKLGAYGKLYGKKHGAPRTHAKHRNAARSPGIRVFAAA